MAGDEAREIDTIQEDMYSQVMDNTQENYGTTRSSGAGKLHGQICILKRFPCRKNEKVKEEVILVVVCSLD